MIDPPLPRAPSDSPTSAARATATSWPKTIRSIPQSSSITRANGRSLAIEIFQQRDSVLARRPEQVSETCRRYLLLLQKMLAQAPSYLVDALSEKVHIWGNSDNGFLPLHHANNFPEFGGAHARLSFDLLQIRRCNRCSTQCGFDSCDDSLLFPLQAYLMFR